MSSENAYLIDKKFNTFGQALAFLLNYRGIEQRWVVDQIVQQGQNFSSLQSQFSRWVKNEMNPSETYRTRINKVLGVDIHQKADGFWYITQPGEVDRALHDVNHAKKKVDEYKAKKPTLDDLPEIVQLKHELEEWIDELLKNRKKND